MSRTILRHRGRRSPVAPIAALLALLGLIALCAPTDAGAHEIPSQVTVLAYVRPDAGRLRILVRAPLESMRDVDWPLRSAGFLDLNRALPLARDAAQLWLADAIQAWEDGAALPAGHVIAARISLPSDRAFASWDSALGTVVGPPLSAATDIPWQQAAIDALIEFPVSDVHAHFAIRPRMARLGLRTTTALHFISADGVERAFEYHGDPGIVRLDPRWYHAAWNFIGLGVTHILSGIDHLLFLLCLVIPFRRFRSLALIVTAFTIAHSITLIASALGVAPSALWFPPLIETLIAASIVYMALENIVGPNLRRRWAIAFGFGLVHGFAFSFAVRESLQFAGSHVLLSLLSFNVGVEIGQLLVLAAIVPLLSFAFARMMPERTGVILVSALVAHTAWHWMLDRGNALRAYDFTWPSVTPAFLASAMRGVMVLIVVAGAAWALTELARRFGGARTTTQPADQ